MILSHLTTDEVDDICRPLRQPAAQARYLARLGLTVARRPDGRPLVRRSEWDRINTQTRGTGPQWSKA